MFSFMTEALHFKLLCLFLFLFRFRMNFVSAIFVFILSFLVVLPGVVAWSATFKLPRSAFLRAWSATISADILLFAIGNLLYLGIDAPAFYFGMGRRSSLRPRLERALLVHDLRYAGMLVAALASF